MVKKFFCALAMIVLICASQSVAEEPPGNWSLDFQGGISSGQFTFGSKITPHGGVKLRYSMNPLVSFYGNLEIGQFRALDSIMDQSGFSNDYFLAGLGARFNVLRMFTGTTPLTERFGLYSTTGMGLMRADVRVNNTSIPGYAGMSYSGNALVLQIGTGITYRISNRIDVFMQTELNHSDSDLLDGYERLPGGSQTGLISGGDSYINTSFGISVKLGSPGAPHAAWHDMDSRRTAPAASLDWEISRMQAELERSERINEQLARQLQSLSTSLNEFSELVGETQQRRLDTHENQIRSLQNRMDQLHAGLDDIPEPPEAPRADPAADQFFIVAGVFQNPDNAERLRRELLNSGFDQASIIFDDIRDYHIVTYSGYPTREQADAEIERIRAQVNPDAWVFTR